MVKNTDITWYIKDNAGKSFISQEDYYAGSCYPEKDFIVDIEVWNNRWNNNEATDDANNCILTLEFTNAEDSILFNYCYVNINNTGYKKVYYDNYNIVSLQLGDILGEKNNGSSMCINNYKTIGLKFSEIPTNLKDGLRTLMFNLEYS